MSGTKSGTRQPQVLELVFDMYLLMKPIIYYDLASQPSRAVLSLVKIACIDVTLVEVRLGKMANQTE